MIVVLLLLQRGVRLAHAYTRASPRFAVLPDRARFLSPAPWLEARDLDDIRRDSGLGGKRLFFFDPDLVSRFREAYARSPWVEAVREVRPRFPNRVDVLLEIREPVAGVPGKDGRIRLLDAEGRRLPGRRTRPPAGLDHVLLRIDGVAAPCPGAGEVWSPAVREGVSVAKILNAHPDLVNAAGIVAVDVSNVGLRRDRVDAEIVLRTDSGVPIEWGRSELSPLAANEFPVEHKLSLLRFALRARPRLAGLERLRIQFREPSYFRRD